MNKPEPPTAMEELHARLHLLEWMLARDAVAAGLNTSNKIKQAQQAMLADMEKTRFLSEHSGTFALAQNEAITAYWELVDQVSQASTRVSR